ESICAGATGLSPRAAALCDVARHYRDVARGIRAAAPASQGLPPISPFAGATSALDAYLHVLWLKSRPNMASTRIAVDIPEPIKSLPMFLYLDFGTATLRQLPELEVKHPRFAELFVFAADLLVSGGIQLAAARKNYTRALELIPDYTRARTGIGNIHLF